MSDIDKDNNNPDNSNLPDNPPSGLQKYVGDLVDAGRFDKDKLKYVKGEKAGLQLMFLSLASSMVKQTFNMHESLDFLQKELFNPEVLAKLPPAQKFAYYRIAAQTFRDNIDFLKFVLSETDWQSLEGMLLQLETAEKVQETVSTASVEQLVELIVQKVKSTTETTRKTTKVTLATNHKDLDPPKGKVIDVTPQKSKEKIVE